MGYTLRKQAEAELESIWLYSYQEWGVEQADQYLHSLISRFSWLSENPLLGKHREDINADYYCFPEGMHLVFYKILEDGIDIIGVPHQSMDVDGYF